MKKGTVDKVVQDQESKSWWSYAVSRKELERKVEKWRSDMNNEVKQVK